MFKIIEWKFIRVLFDLGVRRKLLPMEPSLWLFVNNQKFVFSPRLCLTLPLFFFGFFGRGYFVYFTCFLWCVGWDAGKSIYMSLSFPNFSLRQGSGNFAAQIELELCCPLLSYLFNLCKGCLLALPYQGTNGKKSERQSLWHPFGSTSWTRKEFA